MKVLRICVGTPRKVEYQGKLVQTAIFKSRVDGPVMARRHNLDGDRQADLEVHGGRDKAIYAYSHDYYDDWCREFGVNELEDSQFGENLTIGGGTDEQVLVGARYRLGDAEVTVMQPRIPCYKLGIRCNDKAFPARFWAAGKLGFYLRVDVEGFIEQGQSMSLLAAPDHDISLRRLYEIVIDGNAMEANYALETLPSLDEGWVRRLRLIARARSGR